MFQKIAKHRANDASNDVHRPPLGQADRMAGALLEVRRWQENAHHWQGQPVDLPQRRPEQEEG